MALDITNVLLGILSLILTSIMVSDPPHIENAQREAKRNPVDFTGLVLVGTGLGALQVVLDKGQRDDWFASSFITWAVVISVCALVAFVVWEWHHKHPIVHLNLFRNRSFAVACGVMLIFFIVLLGSTLLIPQFVRLVHRRKSGRDADAGRIRDPAIHAAGRVPGVAHRRALLIDGGPSDSPFSLFHMTNVYAGVDFHTLMMWRIYQPWPRHSYSR